MARIELIEKKQEVESLTAVVDVLMEKSKRDAERIEFLDNEMKLLKM